MPQEFVNICPIAGFNLEAAIQEILQFNWDTSWILRRVICEGNVPQESQLIFIEPGRLACDYLVYCATKTPYVSKPVRDCSPVWSNQLWRSPIRLLITKAGLCSRCLANRSDSPKISQFAGLILCDENIGRFDVPMYHLGGMKEFKACKYVLNVPR